MIELLRAAAISSPLEDGLLCVSTVCAIKAPVPVRAPMAVILIVRIPNRPERPKTLWPVRPVDADLQKIRALPTMISWTTAATGSLSMIFSIAAAAVAFEAGRRHVSSIGMGGHQAGSH